MDPQEEESGLADEMADEIEDPNRIPTMLGQVTISAFGLDRSAAAREALLGIDSQLLSALARREVKAVRRVVDRHWSTDWLHWQLELDVSVNGDSWAEIERASDEAIDKFSWPKGVIGTIRWHWTGTVTIFSVEFDAAADRSRKWGAPLSQNGSRSGVKLPERPLLELSEPIEHLGPDFEQYSLRRGGVQSIGDALDASVASLMTVTNMRRVFIERLHSLLWHHGFTPKTDPQAKYS